MRRDRRWSAARRQRVGERGVIRDEVQRVGIGHQRHVQAQRLSEQLACAIGRAEAGTNDDCGSGVFDDSFRVAQHKLRLGHVDAWSAVGSEPDPHFARAEIRACLGGQNCRADHPIAAAHHRKCAERSFVNVASRPFQNVRQLRRQRCPFEQVSLRGQHAGRIEPERMHADVAAMIRPVRRQQAGFERDERCGRRGTHGRGKGDARVGVETAGHVERQNGNSACVGARYPSSINTLGGALEANAEKTVDDDAEVAAIRPVGKRFSPRRAPGVEGGSGIAGKTLGVAGKNDHDVEEPGREPSGENESVASVVARTREDEHSRRTAGEEIARDAGRGEPGALHELSRCGFRLDCAKLRDAVDVVLNHRDDDTLAGKSRRQAAG